MTNKEFDMHHDLKIFEKYFQPVVDCRLKSIVRSTVDRTFNVGDTITLRAGVPDAAEEGYFKYSKNKEISAVITYIDDFGCQHGYVNLSLGRVGLTIVHKD